MRGLPALDVSRETEEALIHLKDLVITWNPTINLVSKNSVAVSVVHGHIVVEREQVIYQTRTDER